MLLHHRIMKFAPVRHEALWGEEQWLISAHKSSPTMILHGVGNGQTLDAFMPDFPLLVKVIDAHDRLSVQVHPNEQTKLVTGGDAKTEMWCALDDGFVYAGLKEGVTAADIEAAVNDGSFEGLMVRHDMKAGDVLFIPGGLVHAIGEGTKVYEVQQSSDTTFRLYDWGRVGADGKPRQLHVAQALKAIDYTLGVPKLGRAASCEFFDFRRVYVDGFANPVHISGEGWTILYVRKGAIALSDGVMSIHGFPEGDTLLVREGRDLKMIGEDADVFITTGGKK